MIDKPRWSFFIEIFVTLSCSLMEVTVSRCYIWTFFPSDIAWLFKVMLWSKIMLLDSTLSIHFAQLLRSKRWKTLIFFFFHFKELVLVHHLQAILLLFEASFILLFFCLAVNLIYLKFEKVALPGTFLRKPEFLFLKSRDYHLNSFSLVWYLFNYSII